MAVDNPVVWEALVPALKLATLMLNNCHTWAWWDAYLSDNFVPVPKDEIPKGRQHSTHLRFFNRPPIVSNNDQQRPAVMDKLNSIGKEIDFRIYSQYTAATTGYQDGGGTGETDSPTIWRKIKCNIALELIERLLNPHTCVAEKLLAREEIATTILHEITVSLPFRGFSMENAMFGGLHHGINSFIPAVGLGLAGFIRHEFNNYFGCKMADQGCTVLKNKPPGWNFLNFYPVPAQHCSNMNNRSFWESFVKQYGQPSTHMGPRTYGFRFNRVVNLPTDPLNFPDGDVRDNAIIKDRMTDNEKQTINFENDRRAQTRRVKAAMEQLRSVPKPAVPQQISTSSTGQVNNYIEPRFEPPSYQFYKIRQFLFANRVSLALDSLNFEIPEHLLYSYIVEAGLSDLSPTEWRGFLIQCSKNSYIFNWREVNRAPAATHGFVTRVANGWPASEPPQQVQPVEAESVKLFRHGLKLAIRDYEVFAENGREFVKDILRAIINKILRDANAGAVQFSENEFDKCVAYLESQNTTCAAGPKGIIREII
ncbi:hypothetical protein N431DRAFT_462367 [Stipitochalara longipes BDJ]|nr:hypothetical protein N431DRAFT_462367 [Stipitochalara longipes BDJ]